MRSLLYHSYLLVFTLQFCVISSLFAQKPSRSVIDSLEKVRIEAPTAKDSAFGKKAKKIVPKKIYELLFRDIYNSSNGQGQVSEIEQNPYKKYEDRWIRKIYIHRLDVFGHSVYDTLRKPNNWIDKTGNKLHTNTREDVVRNNFLFFSEGDRIDSDLFKDNERYIRQQGIFHDVRIEITPYPTIKNAVDVHVFIQDVWSLLPDGSVGGLDNFTIGLEQRNFQGRGHSWKNTVSYNGKDPRQRTEFASRYLIPSLGKSFVSAQADFQLQRDNKLGGIKLFKPFLTPETKYAGAFEVNYNTNRTFEFAPDPTNPQLSIRNYFWTRSFLFDTWLGRSFKLFFGSKDFRERARFIVALRQTQQRFIKRERQVTDTSYQLYQNTNLTLISLGFSNRRYKRDLLIYGFGRTEDVPVGQLVSVVLGSDKAETGQRTYAGLKVSAATYFKYGYLNSLFNLGSFWKDGKAQQGVFNIENGYFSPLQQLHKNWYTRQFVTIRYTLGINRFNNEYLNISGTDGIQGISSDELRGNQKLVVGLESVLFSPVNVLGFRVAPFVSADVGWVARSSSKLFSSSPYQGYGIGFRFRNETLTFNTFQIKFVYYSGIPALTNPTRFDFDGISSLRFRDFAVTNPEVVVFR